MVGSKKSLPHVLPSEISVGLELVSLIRSRVCNDTFVQQTMVARPVEAGDRGHRGVSLAEMALLL